MEIYQKNNLFRHGISLVVALFNAYTTITTYLTDHGKLDILSIGITLLILVIIFSLVNSGLKPGKINQILGKIILSTIVIGLILSLSTIAFPKIAPDLREFLIGKQYVECRVEWDDQSDGSRIRRSKTIYIPNGEIHFINGRYETNKAVFFILNGKEHIIGINETADKIFSHLRTEPLGGGGKKIYFLVDWQKG